MFCSKCGYKIPAGAAFCPNCGAKVQAEEAVHHSDAPSNAAQPGTEDQPDTEPSGQSGQPAAQTEQGTQTEPESQPDAVPTAGPHYSAGCTPACAERRTACRRSAGCDGRKTR